MTNLDVIKRFLEGKEGKTPKRQILSGIWYYEGRTLQSQKTNKGLELINYNTVIAKLEGYNLSLNKTKYSSTTSKIQSQLYRLASQTNYNIIEYTEQ